MRKLILLTFIFSVSLASCGGDSDAPSYDAKSYGFVPQALHTQRVYQETIVDNQNNTIDISYTDTVSAVNSDGTYAVVQSNAGPVVIDGVNWAVRNETQQHNNLGQMTGYSYVNPKGETVTCTATPHGEGPDLPLTVSMTWSIDFQVNCSDGSQVAYEQNGGVSDIESVTVPAGTFMALKVMSLLSWTDAQGTERFQNITNWRDTVTMASVKETVTVGYAETLPQKAYAVSREIELTSD
jgi:hypothetical protein